MALAVSIGDRLVDAATEWADQRMLDEDDALEQKLEQALLEVEHLASGTTEIAFELDGRTLHYAPSDELDALLDEQADGIDADPATVLELHLELFARTFLPEDSVQPGAGPGAPVDADDW